MSIFYTSTDFGLQQYAWSPKDLPEVLWTKETNADKESLQYSCTSKTSTSNKNARFQTGKLFEYALIFILVYILKMTNVFKE